VDECLPLKGGVACRNTTGDAPSRAVQVDPIKTKLKSPGTKRLKLQNDILLSTSAGKFNLRRYILVEKGAYVKFVGRDADGNESTPLWWVAVAAGAPTRPSTSHLNLSRSRH